MKRFPVAVVFEVPKIENVIMSKCSIIIVGNGDPGDRSCKGMTEDLRMDTLTRNG